MDIESSGGSVSGSHDDGGELISMSLVTTDQGFL